MNIDTNLLKRKRNKGKMQKNNNISLMQMTFLKVKENKIKIIIGNNSADPSCHKINPQIYNIYLIHRKYVKRYQL